MRVTLKWVAEKPTEKSKASSIDNWLLVPSKLLCRNTNKTQKKTTININEKMEERTSSRNRNKILPITITFCWFFYALALEKRKP